MCVQCGRDIAPYKQKTVCCEGNFCNNMELDVIDSLPSDGLNKFDAAAVLRPAILIPVALSALLVTIVGAIMLRVWCQRRAKRTLGSDLELANACDVDETSGGGGGGGKDTPPLEQLTIGRQIEKTKQIGQGRYGEVWLARWFGDLVAVKQSYGPQKESWQRERDIYESCVIRHNNILCFIGADTLGKCDEGTAFLLITAYHPLGSLHNYLQSHRLAPQSLHRLAASLTAGLTFLHMDNLNHKPAIAHRDIKSANILVNDNGECIIADFELAVRQTENLATVKVQVGTHRYMAPELLDSTLNPANFSELTAADIYALGLVFWEMAMRCETKSADDNSTVCDAYKPPYADDVPSEPCIANMRAVVCDRSVRPPIPERWNRDDTLHALSKIMIDCWHDKPAARLPALRIRKTLDKFGESNFICA